MSIKNFEEHTHDLTSTEMEIIVPAIIKGLNTKIGKENAITNKQMVEGLYAVKRVRTTGPRIRKMINHIRLSGKIERLVATSKGYYISNDPEELKDYVESLHQRAESIAALAAQLDFQTKKFTGKIKTEK
jgi:hypothetical protein